MRNTERTMYWVVLNAVQEVWGIGKANLTASWDLIILSPIPLNALKIIINYHG